jgi:hypothetical protein
MRALKNLFEQRRATLKASATMVAGELAINAMLKMKAVINEQPLPRALGSRAMEAIDKIKSDLAYRLPTSGRPLKHVVLERDLGEALLRAIHGASE